MRHIALLVVGLTASPVASAVDMQLMTKLDGNIVAKNHLDIGMFGSAFITPGSGPPLYFYYIGPGYQVTDGWWSSIRTGMVVNLPESGKAAPIVSWWNSVTPLDGPFSLFAETEIYPHNSGVIYYGNYVGDWDLDPLSIGLHGEQIDTDVTAGPHVLLKFNGHLVTGIEHHWDFLDGHALRLIVSVKFDD